ncbi:MAG: ABC transporter ATP-binding protein [Lentisphaerae bacterium]|jgi:putative ABC transport system ATP-binding protein|nr:ABC transporter ATP-binding protein [Lentisphaerota bacterium]
MSEFVLEVRGLCKGYGVVPNRVEVLNGIDLELNQGAFEAVMGPSGSGKSTLLHLLAGLLAADSGEVTLGGVKVTTMSDAEVTVFRRRRIGLVFQDFNLIPTLSAEENIVLPLLLDKRRPDRGELDALLARLNLTARRSHLPSQLSGGERQRVAIARALVTRPAIVLADEPTGNLDSPAGRAFCDTLRMINSDDGVTILMVSHDPVVTAAANRVHLLKDGEFVGNFGTESDAALVSQRYLEIMKG